MTFKKTSDATMTGTPVSVKDSKKYTTDPKDSKKEKESKGKK
jgi:hypothetical protein